MPEHTPATDAIHRRLEELASLPVPDAEGPWQALRASLPDRGWESSQPVELSRVRAARRHRRTVRRALALAATLVLMAGSAFAASRTGLLGEIRRHLGGAPQGAQHDVPVSGPSTGLDLSDVGGGNDEGAGTGTTAGQNEGTSGTASGGDSQTAGDGDADNHGGTTSTGTDEAEDQDGDSQGDDAQSGQGDEQGPGNQGSGSQDGGGDSQGEGGGSGSDHSSSGDGNSSDRDSQD